MKKALFALSALLALSAHALDSTAFAHALTIVPNRAAHSIAEPVPEFPVLVRLSTSVSGFSYGDFLLADGGDLRFTDEHGEDLPFEIETWNPSGESLVWVQVPLFSDYTEIRAYWGNAEPPEKPAGMWKDYVAVYHLDSIDANGVTPDATAHHLDLTASDASQDTVSDVAKVGKALGIVSRLSSTNVYPAVQGPYEQGKRQWTVSMWVKHDGVSKASWYSFLGIEGSCWYGFYLSLPNSLTKIRTYRADNTTKDVSVSTFAQAGWTHLLWVMDGTVQHLYRNGVEIGDLGYAGKATMQDGKGFYVGGFTGTADETRFYQGAYSPSRAALDYAVFADDFLVYNGKAPTPSATMPTVTVEAGEGADEAARTAGAFTISIPSALSAPLVVRYAMSGRAVPGETYRELSGYATIPAGETEVGVAVCPMNDTSVMWDVAATMTLLADDTYTLGSASSASVTVVNDPAQVPTYTYNKVTYRCPVWTGAAGNRHVDDLLNWSGLGPDGFYPTNCPAFAMTSAQTSLTLSQNLVETAAGTVQVLTDATFDFTGKELSFTNAWSSFKIGKNAHVKLTGGTVSFNPSSCEAYEIKEGATFEVYGTRINHRTGNYIGGSVERNATFILGDGAYLNAGCCNPYYGENARLIVKDGARYSARGDSGMTGPHVSILVKDGGCYATGRLLRTDYDDFTLCAIDGGTNAVGGSFGVQLAKPTHRMVHTNAVYAINRSSPSVKGGARVELVDSLLYNSVSNDGTINIFENGYWLISGTKYRSSYAMSRTHVGGSNAVFEVANGADFSVNHNDFYFYGTNPVWRLTGANVTTVFPGWVLNSSTATCARVEVSAGTTMKPTDNYAFGGIGTRIEIDGTSKIEGVKRLNFGTGVGMSVTVAFAGAAPRLAAANTLTFGAATADDPTVLDFAIPDGGFAATPVDGAGTVVLNASTKVRVRFAGRNTSRLYPLVTAKTLDLTNFSLTEGHDLPRHCMLVVKGDTLYLKTIKGMSIVIR